MDEQSAISRLNLLFSDVTNEDYPFTEVFAEAVAVAIKALEEVKEYRAIGLTPEQLKEVDRLYSEKCKELSQLQKKYKVAVDWIPVTEKYPENSGYVLVSFENFSLPDIARYEEDENGGAFYPGDDEKSYVQYGLFVNAWQALPVPYKEADYE